MRINKFLTDSGFCSRREADKLISAGKVKINSKIAVLGDQIKENDQVFVNNRLIDRKSKNIYIMYNKPKGVVCTTDKSEPGNIIDAINFRERIFPIGRLDKDSTGLIFLTNDGDIVNKILRAENGHEKEYWVNIDKPFDEDFEKKMKSGVDIGGYKTLPCKLTRVNKSTFLIVLKEGKNRQIRRMCEALGCKVRHLKRIRIMNVLLGDLKEGQWKEIPAPQLKKIMELVQ